MTPSSPASMRPRPGGRGERLIGPQQAGLQHGFNAATTRRPWRAIDPPARPPEKGDGLQCGHDPEAVESDQRGRRAGDDRNASMRPRPGGRGERYSTALTDLLVRSFNAATTRRPWRALAGRTERNCERGFNAATTRRPWRAALAAQKAACRAGFNAATTRRPWRTPWRPWRCRQRCGFNAATTRRPWRAGGVCKIKGAVALASMRPRPGGRGERNRRSFRRSSSATLQCGHDPEAVESRSVHGCRLSRRSRFNAATTRRPWRAAAAGAAAKQAAQGGFNAATTRRPWRATRPRRGPGCGKRFNAATTRRPWRASTNSPMAFQVGVWLQCGHDPEAVESDMRPPNCGLGRSEASMRPRPGGRGEPRRVGRRGKGMASFNAATTRRPWRAFERVTRPTDGGKLQCGHDPEAVESFERVTRPTDGGSFNAATTRRPWRDHYGSGVDGGQGSFNAATTRRPWRAPLTGADPSGSIASMRPRPGGRGERLERRHGHGDDTGASMRPRPGGRGELQLRNCTRTSTPRASMRPRPGGRGEPLRPSVHHVHVVEASMRPRPGGRGE